MENEYVGDEKFFECLEKIKTLSSKFTNNTKQEIYETLLCYIENKHRIDPETLSYLFTGFIIKQMLRPILEEKSD